MSAVMRAFVPTLSLTQSQQKLQKLLTAGKANVTSPKRKALCAMWWQDNGEKG
jgi:hypothetical protein